MSTTTNATPKKSNIRKLAELICRTGNADQIMVALTVAAASGALNTLNPEQQKGDRQA